MSRRPTSVMYDIEKGFPTCSTLTATCSFGVALWVYYLVSSPFPYIICFCVCLTKRKRKTEHLVLSSRPTSVMSDIEKRFISCKVTLCTACSFVLILWVYSLFSSPVPYIICLCGCFTKKEKKRKIISVVKSSRIDNVWYWKMVYHLLHDTNCSMQFWWWHASVCPCLIPLPRYNVCVCNR